MRQTRYDRRLLEASDTPAGQEVRKDPTPFRPLALAPQAANMPDVIEVKPMCRTERHRLCGGHRCSCSCHPGTPQEREAKADVAVRDFLAELVEVAESRGRHEGHTLRQVGRCLYCSCGVRYQGTLPRKVASGD